MATVEEKEQKLAKEYGEFIAFDVTFPTAVRFFRQDFESDEAWEEFKKKMLNNPKEAEETLLDNLHDIGSVDDLIGYPSRMTFKVREVHAKT